MQESEGEWLLHSVCGPLGLRLMPDQCQRMLGYIDLLQRWNGTYNLTAVRDRAGMLTQHLADCLAVVPPLARHLQTVGAVDARLLDVGSGGGLPSAVLAIVFPQIRVTSVDTVGKKAAFVRQVAGVLALPNLESVHTRVENLRASPFQVITSRAFGSLVDFTRLTRSHLASGAVWMAMKGKHPQDEIDELPQAIDVFHVEQLHVPGLDAERCLVWMRLRPATFDEDT